jgi:hypothetical protein
MKYQCNKLQKRYEFCNAAGDVGRLRCDMFFFLTSRSSPMSTLKIYDCKLFRRWRSRRKKSWVGTTGGDGVEKKWYGQDVALLCTTTWMDLQLVCSAKILNSLDTDA